MIKNLKAVIILTGTLLLCACSSSIKNNVTRFHHLPPVGGQTIEVISIDPTLQQSIEFRSYAQLIGSKLGNVGFRPPENGTSQYIAEIGYGIAPIGNTVIDNDNSGVSFGMGVGSGGRRSSTSLGLGISTSFGSSEPVVPYVSRLTMNIVDLSTGQRLYEGHVESINKNPNLAQIMPYMVDALFQNFPGESGKTETIKINTN